jgi:hypothetical protein
LKDFGCGKNFFWALRVPRLHTTPTFLGVTGEP